MADGELTNEEWEMFDKTLKEARGESLPEIKVYREANSFNWTVERPDPTSSPQHLTNTTSLEIARIVFDAIRSLGGRAIVSYRDDNSLTARKARADKETN
jgi:hypothetical protein